MCGCFGNMCTGIYCVLYCLYCVCCIVSFVYIYSYLFCLYQCKEYCHRLTTQLQLIIIIIIIIIIIRIVCNCTNFTKIQEPSQNSRCQSGGLKRVPLCEPHKYLGTHVRNLVDPGFVHSWDKSCFKILFQKFRIIFSLFIKCQIMLNLTTLKVIMPFLAHEVCCLCKEFMYASSHFCCTDSIHNFSTFSLCPDASENHAASCPVDSGVSYCRGKGAVS